MNVFGNPPQPKCIGQAGSTGCVRLVESAPQQLAGSHDCGPIACHVARVLCEGGDLTTVDPTNPLALRDAIATAILQVRDEFTTRT